MTPKAGSLAVVFLLLASSVLAKDVYVLAFQAWGAEVDDPSLGHMVLEWRSDAFLHNNGLTDARIELLDNLNGIVFTIPSHRTASLLQQVTARGAELLGGEIGVVHLRVPDTVIIENSLYINAVNGLLHSPEPPLPFYGKVHLPTFTELVPSGQRQVHLDTWTGIVPSHRNVLVYNAGDAVANAVIEIRQHCDDALLYSVTEQVQPQRIAHFIGLPGGTVFGTGATCGSPTFMEAGIYTVVTVDQPSLTLVSSVPEGKIPSGFLSVN